MIHPWRASVDWLDRRGWLDRVPWLRPWLRRDYRRSELLFLLACLLAVALAYGFIKLAGEVREGDTQTFDEWAVRSLRQPAPHADTPVGPAWLREVGIDLTALGSFVVLVLVVSAVAGFLYLQHKYRLTVLVLAATAGGMLLNTALKHVVDRQRPSVVPHLREVHTPSFPSGHSMLSAVVYLTLGALLMGIVDRRVTKLYCIGVALSLTFLVGASRVYLGVHYPTDVLAGWSVGLVWALLCWLVERYLQWRGALGREAEGQLDEEGPAPSEA
jgi:undecaprenyl-diphosphatase